MRILLLTPPMTQLNTPYPATAYLTGFLRKNSYDARQADPAIELTIRIFSRTGLSRVLKWFEQKGSPASSRAVKSFLFYQQEYLSTIDSVIRFLQGKDPSLALRIVTRGFLPEGPRFAP